MLKYRITVIKRRERPDADSWLGLQLTRNLIWNLLGYERLFVFESWLWWSFTSPQVDFHRKWIFSGARRSSPDLYLRCDVTQVRRFLFTDAGRWWRGVSSFSSKSSVSVIHPRLTSSSSEIFPPVQSFLHTLWSTDFTLTRLWNLLSSLQTLCRRSRAGRQNLQKLQEDSSFKLVLFLQRRRMKITQR